MSKTYTFPSGITLTQDPNDPTKYISTKDDKPFDWTEHMSNVERRKK